MGIFGKIKGWLNIGGPKVSISAIEQPISGKVGTIVGNATVTSKREAKITSVTTRFIMDETTGTGEEKETKSETIAEEKINDEFVIPADGAHEISISLDYDTTGLADKLASKGGLLGAVGKMSKLAGKLGDKGIKDYFVEVECDVVGTALDPNDRMPVRAMIED